MSAQDSDGVEDAIQGVTQVAMTTAARMGEQLARAREKRAREAQASSEQAGREYAGRFTAEREAVRAALAPVNGPQWWNDAQGEEISKAYQTATAWKDIDPDAARAERRIVEEVQTRFDVDLTRDGDPGGVTDALAREEQARANAQDERGAVRAEAAQAVGLMAGADAHDRAAEQQDVPLDERIAAAQAEVNRLGGFSSSPRDSVDVRAADDELRKLMAERDALPPQQEPADWENDQSEPSDWQNPAEEAHAAYDSAERRQELAASLDHIGNRAAVDARVRADVSQGRPATDATASAPGRAPKARKTRGNGQPARTTQRTGRSR